MYGRGYAARMTIARAPWILVLVAFLGAAAVEPPVAAPAAAPAPTPAPTPAPAPVANKPATPRILRVREVLRAHWPEWFAGKERILVTDIDDRAADPAVKGEDAAAIAALFQEVNRLRAKESVEGLDCAKLFPPEGEGDAATWRRLHINFQLALSKAKSIPTELWSSDGPTFAAVRQSREGDCWLLATTGWMVKHRPDVVRNAIEPIGDGRWRVRFADGEVVEVSTPTVTELITVNSQATLKEGLWLPVVKEAMGEILGESNAKKAEIEAESLRIAGGSGARMFQRWTGHKVRTIRLEGRTPVDEVRKALVDGMARKAAMGAGTPKEPKGKVPPNHALAIFGFDATRDMVITWNPWANDFKPKGEPGRENGYAREDGISEIPLADFCDLFRGLWIETDEPAPRPAKAAAPARVDAGARPAGAAAPVSP